MRHAITTIRHACRRALIVSTALLTGCSSWINPHVTPSSDKSFTFARAEGTPYAGNLTPALAYARAWQERYYEAVGEDSLLRNGLALVLIPLAAGGVYLAATSSSRSSRDAIVAGATGGAALFGLGSYLQSTPKQRNYLAGHQAIGCAMLAMQPQMRTQKELDDFRRDLTALNNAIPGLESAIAVAEQVNARASDAGLAFAIQQAQRLLDRARLGASEGGLVAVEIENAGTRLGVAVNSIAGQVSRRIVDGEPDLAALARIVGDLGGTMQKFRPVLPGAPVTTPATDPNAIRSHSAGGVNPVDALQRESRRTAEKLSPVAAFISETREMASRAPALSSCGLPAASFSVSPDTTVTLKRGSTVEFQVITESGPPGASVIGRTLTGVEFDPVPRAFARFYQFTLTSEADAEAGDTAIRFVHPDGVTSKTVAVVVEGAAPSAPAKQPTGAPPQQPPGPQGAVTETEKQMPLDQVKELQKALGFSASQQDGRFGPRTRAAIAAAQKATNAPVNGRLANTNVEPIKRNPFPADKVANALSDYEKSDAFNQSILKQVQAALNVPQTGTFDAATRAAIAKFLSDNADAKAIAQQVERESGGKDRLTPQLVLLIFGVKP